MRELILIVASFVSVAALAAPSTQPAKINVLVVSGGHGFKAGSFFKLFDDNPEIVYQSASEATSAEAYDREDLLGFDVVVLYDFQRELTDAQKAGFLSLFDKGVGIVVLHHALLSYQSWPEYERIAGGKYLLDSETHNRVTDKPSTYQGDVEIAVKVVAPNHPITAGLSDFVLRDEIYRGVRMRSDVNTLLTAEDKPLA